jgi:hypothetical protein
MNFIKKVIIFTLSISISLVVSASEKLSKNSIFIRDEKKAKYWTNFGYKNLSETDQSLISILRN